MEGMEKNVCNVNRKRVAIDESVNNVLGVGLWCSVNLFFKLVWEVIFIPLSQAIQSKKMK